MALIGHVDEISRSVVQGWVVDTEQRDETVLVAIFVNDAHRGMCLTTHPREDVVLPTGEKISGNCGFHFTFDPPLSPFIELRIDVAETWSGQVLPNGSRILPRPRSHDGDGAEMMPILLTSTGRTGTTLLMSEFARHPDLVVGDQFPYEIKQIAYHAAAFRALAADADWERSTKPETMLAPEMHRIIGSNPYKMGGLFGLGGAVNALREFYQWSVPSGYAALFRRFIVEFYATLANAQGKRSALYFCEKGDVDAAAVLGARLFFDGVKDIVIVRDPRDLMCSAIAFWKLRPETALTMLATTIPRLVRLTRVVRPDTIVIRYEDLVREPMTTRQALSRFLDLDLLSSRAVEAVPVPDSHRTSRDAQGSIGRWRNDLTPDQVAACEATFGHYMRDFDYELSTAGRGRKGSRPNRRGAQVNQIVVAEGAPAVAAFGEYAMAETEDGVGSRQVLEIVFGRDGTGESFTSEGWSFPERGFVWSNAARSDLRLPPIHHAGEYRLHITAAPFTHGAELPAQRVMVQVDGTLAGSARVRDVCVLSVPVPPAACRSEQAVHLTFRFPDAARPSDILALDEDRLLGFSLHRLALVRVDAAPSVTNIAPRCPVDDGAAAADVLRRAGPDHPGHDGDRPESDTGRDDDLSVVTRFLELARVAFEQPSLQYHARTVPRHIPGYNTARFIQLILGLETEFRIVLREDEVDSIETFGDMLALLRTRLSASGRADPPSGKDSRTGKGAKR